MMAGNKSSGRLRIRAFCELEPQHRPHAESGGRVVFRVSDAHDPAFPRTRNPWLTRRSSSGVAPPQTWISISRSWLSGPIFPGLQGFFVQENDVLAHSLVIHEVAGHQNRPVRVVDHGVQRVYEFSRFHVKSLDGSSAMSRSGSWMMAHASFVACFMPVEKLPILVAVHPCQRITGLHGNDSWRQ